MNFSYLATGYSNSVLNVGVGSGITVRLRLQPCYLFVYCLKVVKFVNGQVYLRKGCDTYCRK